MNKLFKSSSKTNRRVGILPQKNEIREEGVTLKEYPKSKNDETLIKSALENNDFLSNVLTGKRLHKVINCLVPRKVKPGEVLISQGENGAHVYISNGGNFEVIIDKETVQSFNDVRVFGELAMIYNANRLATVKSVSYGSVWELDCTVFKQLMLRSQLEEQKEIVNFLRGIPEMNSVSEGVLEAVANLFKQEFFKTGTEIVQQGDIGDKFYIITAGMVTVSKRKQGIVCKLYKGDFFGELAILKTEYRQATVTADPPGVECLTLSRQHFKQHFGEIDAFNNIKIPKVLPQHVIKKNSDFSDYYLEDFVTVKTIGIGAYSCVDLVQNRLKKNQVFALKTVKKSTVVKLKQQQYLHNEKQIQLLSNSPFLVKLYCTFKNEKHVYFLMECCLGGDLFSLLCRQKNNRLGEGQAKFVCACILEGIAYLHERNIVYRDLKTENCVIGQDGYVKLTDFGFAKRLDTLKTYTFVGTPEYIAPEIILNRGHDKSVDIWSFGVIVFEVLTGRSPFSTEGTNNSAVYNLILRGIGHVRFPKSVSKSARRVIENLCKVVPSERLGCSKKGLDDLRNDDWFKEIDFEVLRERKIISPFTPDLDHNLDTKYFESFDRYDEGDLEEEHSGWDKDF